MFLIAILVNNIEKMPFITNQDYITFNFLGYPVSIWLQAHSYFHISLTIKRKKLRSYLYQNEDFSNSILNPHQTLFLTKTPTNQFSIIVELWHKNRIMDIE